MKDFYIDLGDLAGEGIMLSAKVTAPSRRKAVEALRDMLIHRLGKEPSFIEIEGGRLDGSKCEVSDVQINIDPHKLSPKHIVEED